MSVFKLIPAGKDYLWGGRRLIDNYHKHGDGPILAETWELSCHPDGPSTIADGAYQGQTLEQYLSTKGSAVLGHNCARFDHFPVLIKFIDAKQNLSIQVHPSDAYALSHEHSFGKTEMWYVLEAEPEAFLYYGFEHEISKEEFEQSIRNNTLTDKLHQVKVKAGDVFFIPSGTIHAIGAGIVIAEIQQNSNLTYRVYDYGRVGADGKPRQLHVDKALAVTTLAPAQVPEMHGHLGICDYFCVDKLELTDKLNLEATDASFVHLLAVRGEGTLHCGSDTISWRKGDSLFIEAGSGAITVEGTGELLQTTIPAPQSVRIGIDVGGTDCKLGLVTPDHRIISKSSIPTESQKGAEDLVKRLAVAVTDLLQQQGLTLAQCTGIGIDIPGTCDRAQGVVVYSNNIKWANVPIAALLAQELGTKLPIKIANDADAAALGEVVAGAGMGCTNAVMLTIGTGFGTGVIINGHLYTGFGVGSTEFGHTVMVANGGACTCGRKGCIEYYATATALIREAKAATGLTINAKQIYERVDAGDSTLKAVLDQYLDYLKIAVANAANTYNPEIIIMGGGMSAQKERLTDPLNEFLQHECFGAAYRPIARVVPASLGNDAGIIGAACLLNDE